MYANELTLSMEKAIKETNRRRKIQEEYNKEHNIIPKTIKKDIRDIIQASIIYEDEHELDLDNLNEIITKLTDKMISLANDLKFEEAAEIRDEIQELEKYLNKME